MWRGFSLLSLKFLCHNSHFCISKRASNFCRTHISLDSLFDTITTMYTPIPIHGREKTLTFNLPGRKQVYLSTSTTSDFNSSHIWTGGLTFAPIIGKLAVGLKYQINVFPCPPNICVPILRFVSGSFYLEVVFFSPLYICSVLNHYWLKPTLYCIETLSLTSDIPQLESVK